jgi:large subunit ribosomal protein L6
MSRIGKKPIPIPKGVDIKIGADALEVKGPKGVLRSPVPAGITVKIEDGVLKVERTGDELVALQGLTRALAANAIKGVSEGFTRELCVVGVGYKAELKGHVVHFSLGYSHPIEFPVPPDLEVKVDRLNRQIEQYQMSVVISGCDKQRVGQVAADLRGLRRPDAYKGKGVRFAEEVVRLKPGKAGTKGG